MKTILQARILSIVFFALFLFVGCDSASTNDEVLDEETSADVAATVALSVSEEDGGVADQLEDVVTLTNQATLSKDAPANPNISSSDPEYDATTGIWTVDILRERTSQNEQRSISYQRTYEYQFLDANGDPQQFFNTDSTLAKTLIFRIVSGSGEYSSPEMINTLNSLTADWRVDNADEDMFSISGSYQRDASTIIERALITRTMAYNVSLNQLEINVPRGGGLRDFTGLLSGEYEAVRNTSVENSERDVQVSTSIEIAIDENQVTIDIDRERFISTLDTGELIQ